MTGELNTLFEPVRYQVRAQYNDDNKETAFIERAGVDTWAIRNQFGECMAHDGEWSDEPLPSARDADYLAVHRFPSAEAAANAYRDYWPHAQLPPMQSSQHQTTGHAALWQWFGLSYSSWLVMPRVLLHAMPDDWQGQLAKLLEQWEDAFNTDDFPEPSVSARAGGRLTKWPEWLLNYRHPNHAQIDALRSNKE